MLSICIHLLSTICNYLTLTKNTFQDDNISIILKNNSMGMLPKDPARNNCTNSHAYEAATSFKILLQEYLLNNNSENINFSDDTIDHLTNLQANLTIIASSQQDIEVRKCISFYLFHLMLCSTGHRLSSI